MKMKLSINDYDFLKKYAPDAVAFIDVASIENENVRFSIINFDEFAVEHTFAVLDVGMDDEDTVNEIGKRLYNIYDKILYQKHQQEEKEKSNDSE